jgi:hypothetical protein
MDYNSLVASSATAGSIANWMSKSSLAGGPAMAIVQEAESWVYRRLRHWQMLTAPVPITMSIGSDTIPMPAGFLQPTALWYLNGGAPFWMAEKLPNQVYALWSYDATNARVNAAPVYYTFNQSAIQMDSPADQAYPGYITYYQQLPALSASNTNNFLTDTYPRMLRCACMAGACEWAKDNGQGQFDRTYWDQLCMDEIYTAQQESDRARRGVENAAVLIGGSTSGFPAYAGVG